MAQRDRPLTDLTGIATGGFRPSDRLLDSRDFRHVMRRGRRRAGRDLIVCYSAPNPRKPKYPRRNSDLRDFGESRIGITVSRKVGNAVCRNRFKRRVRAWFRSRRSEINEVFGRDGIDLVVIARKSAGPLGLDELDQRLCELLGLDGSRQAS